MRSYVARPTVAILGVVFCACGEKREESPRVDRSPTVTAAAADCTDSIETRALACSGGTARRVGNTLFVRLGTGAETRFVDNASAEDDEGYRYVGRVASNRFHIVERNGNESEPTYHLVNAATGVFVITEEIPRFSPDAQRFAIGGSHWDNCAEANGGKLEVWRITDSVPVIEWRTVTQACGRSVPAGWGAVDLRWRSPDTLAFMREDFAPRDTSVVSSGAQRRRRPMLLVGTGARWAIVAPR